MNKVKCLLKYSIMFFVCIIGISNVNADVTYSSCSAPFNINRQTYNKYTLWGNNTSDDSQSWKFNELTSSGKLGRVIYCLAHGVPLDLSGGSFVYYQSLDSPNDLNNLIARILAYGYISDSDEYCSVARIGTQAAVHMAARHVATGDDSWLGFSASKIAGMFSGSYASDIGIYTYNLKEKVKTHGVVPSFSKSTASAATSDASRVELKYDEATYSFSNTGNLLVDTSSVLSGYSVSSLSEKIKPEKINNTLKITSYDDKVTEPITMSKVFPTGSTVYRRVIGSYQPTVYSTAPTNKTTTVYAGYKYEVIGKGRIGIHKIDRYTSKNMKDVTFGIYSDDKCTVKAKDYLGNELSSKKTDKNGLLEWNNLYYPLKKDLEKVYYVKELEMESGYTTDRADLEALKAGENNCIPVTLKAKNETGIKDEENETYEYIGINNYVVTAIHNIPYGNVTILKQDEDTGSAVEGVEFKLLKFDKDRTPATDINGEPVKNAVTNKWGVAVFEDIPYGDYILEEVKTPGSHKPLEEPIEFTLNKNTDALKYKNQGVEALPIIDVNDKFTYVLGDPTKDKKIDNSDLEILNKLVIGETENITIDQKYACDVNQDGKVNSKDVDVMTKYINGETTLIEMKEVEVTTDDLVPPETYKLGDPTDDGIIDNNDLAIIEKIIKANATPEVTNEQTEETQPVEITKVEKYASDINLDGIVDEKDKELMISYLGGNKAAFEGLKEIAYPDQFQVKATLVVTNVPIDIKISKQAITNSKEIKGATIVIKTKDGKVFHKYKSTGKKVEFYIPAGEYTLIEEIAPKGYENLKTEVKFTVGTDGNVKLLSAKSKMYKLVKSEEETDTDLDHLIIYNNLKKVIVPNTGSTIGFISIIGGTLLVASGAYVIFKRYNAVN